MNQNGVAISSKFKKSWRKSGLFYVGLLSLWGVIFGPFFISPAYSTQVAFFRQYTPSGQLVKYDGGEFAHIAISFQKGWLHAHPYGGVQWSPSLEAIGFLDYVVLENTRWSEPTQEFAAKQLQKKFDIFASWLDPLKTYCSKLVAEFFNIRPQVMTFSSKDWQGFNVPRGHLGLSPDDVYRHLIEQKNFKPLGLDTYEGLRSNSRFESKSRRCDRFLSATLL